MTGPLTAKGISSDPPSPCAPESVSTTPAPSVSPSWRPFCVARVSKRFDASDAVPCSLISRGGPPNSWHRCAGKRLSCVSTAGVYSRPSGMRRGATPSQHSVVICDERVTSRAAVSAQIAVIAKRRGERVKSDPLLMGLDGGRANARASGRGLKPAGSAGTRFRRKAIRIEGDGEAM